MTKSVLEIAEFRAAGDPAVLRAAANAMEPWLRAQRGFRWRRLAALEGDVFLDCIEWADMESAKAAADQIMTAPPAAEFMAQIDGSSVIMRHALVQISQ